MPTDPQGNWVPKIFSKQAELINLCRAHKKRYILASGPRLSGKTLGVLHALADHAWNTANANIAIVSITQSAGYDSGVWTDLVETILPEWIAADFGFEWVRPPSIQHVSKKPYCTIRNKFGGISKFQLESLKNEQEVEMRFKSKRYSCMFINELSNFKRRKTLDTWSECLRMVNLPYKDHVLIADTNPADEGTKSWIYKLWFELPNIPAKELKPDERALQPMLQCVNFTIPDNSFVGDDRITALKAVLSNNRDLYDRYVLGKWVTASLDALFVDVFREEVHVVPEPTSFDIMIPEEACFELYTGWDLGVVNSAAVILEKFRKSESDEGAPSFKALDELVVVGEDFSMGDFVREFVEKMRFWEKLIGAAKLRWFHYSDRSAFDMKEPETGRYHHQIVFDECPEDTPGGRIQLIAAPRGPQSVQMRIDLFRKLLWEERMYLSRDRTPKAVEMIQSIKRGKSTLAPIERGSPHKHVFDALTYPIASECIDELQTTVIRTIRTIRQNANGVISVRM